MSPTLTLIFICTLWHSSRCLEIIPPTVVNTTGEYYIADAISFVDGTIVCNSTRNCHTICPILFSCKNTVISCSSSVCNLECSALESCYHTQFNVDIDPTHLNASAIATNVVCADSYACYNTHISAFGATTSAHARAVTSSFTATLYSTSSLLNSTFTVQDYTSATIYHISDDCIGNTYRLQNINSITLARQGDNSYGYNVSSIGDTFIINDANDINMTCIGTSACSHYRLITNHSSATVHCIGSKACHGLDIVQSIYDRLELLCIHGHAVCLGVSLLVSPQLEATRLICNGTSNSYSCNDITVTVPYHHHPTFLSTVFVTDEIAHSGSFDGFRMNCLNHALCTNYTSFPILYGAAAYSNKTVDNAIYFEGSEAYQYQFKLISCKDGEECFIDCNQARMCANTWIECAKGSVCHIYCLNAYDCDHMTLNAFSDNVELICGASNACHDTNIWLPSSFENGFLNISTCNQYQSCHHMAFMCGDSHQFISSEFKLNDDGRYLCENESCCPWNTITNDTFKCAQSDDCTVDCDNEWGNPYAAPIGCKDVMIDGTASKHLNVNCRSSGNCVNITVLCPSGSCNIHCGEASCVNATIQVKHTKSVNIHCRDPQSCTGASITSYDSVQFALNCSDTMACDNVRVFSNTSVDMEIKCNVNRSCHGLKVYSNLVHELDVMCNSIETCVNTYIQGENNGNVSLICTDYHACDGLSMDMHHVDNVDIKCSNLSCMRNVFDVKYVTNAVSVTCVDAHACRFMDFDAKYVNRVFTLRCLDTYSCDNMQLAANYVNDSADVFCNAQYSCSGSLNAQHANRLNIHQYSAAYYGNYALYIAAPVKAKSIYVYCKQFGCNALNVSSVNGLSDVYTRWSGDCYSENIVDYVTRWDVSCGDDKRHTAQYYGTYCIGNDRCCSAKDVERIQNAFDEYYYHGNGNKSIACGIPTHHEPSHPGRAAGIIIGIIVVGFIGCIGYHYYRQTDCWRFVCFLMKQKVKSRSRQESEEYMTLN